MSADTQSRCDDLWHPELQGTVQVTFGHLSTSKSLNVMLHFTYNSMTCWDYFICTLWKYPTWPSTTNSHLFPILRLSPITSAVKDCFFFSSSNFAGQMHFSLISVHCNNRNSVLQMTPGCPATPSCALGLCCAVQEEVCVALIAQRVRNTCQVCREISEFKTLWVSLLTSLHLKLKAKPLINRAKSA